MKRVRWFFVVLSIGLLSAAGCAGLFSAGSLKTTINYSRPELLVSTAWLQENLRMKNLFILDARNTGYETAHIPGAVHITVRDFKPEEKTLPVRDLEKRLGALGLQNDYKIIIYDDAERSDGAAGWFFWLLEYLGCPDVQVVNGGWDKWVAEKRPVEKEIPQFPSVTFMSASKVDLLAETSSLPAPLRGPDVFILDTRSDEEYNGWALRGETRGGHIPGAVHIPYSWFFKQDKTMSDPDALKNFLDPRGITPNRKVILYSDNGVRSGMVYLGLRLMGHKQLSVYEDFKSEWASNPAKPLEKMVHYEKLVNAQWVKDLIDGKNPPTYPGKGYVILETRYTGFSISMPGSTKESGFIPGAITIHPSYIENEDNTDKYYPKYSHPDEGNLMPIDQFQKALAKLGITRDTTVVVYGNGKIIPMTASRVAWALMVAGVEDVRILNGGFTAWLSAGYPVSSNPAPRKPVAGFGAKTPQHPEYLATTDYVEAISKGKNPEGILVDVRKKEEYEGKINPYPYFTAKGAIPGAVWMGDWDVMVDMNDNTFRSYAEIREHWKKLGITSAKEPVFYCGGGWRSAMGFFLTYLMGYDKTRNFGGGFYEWSWDSKRPVTQSNP
jgi:thiosulfate/3-mercaptopyruvate sulfurtransferase